MRTCAACGRPSPGDDHCTLPDCPGAITGRQATRQPHPSYCPFHACQRVVCRCGILPDPPGRQTTCPVAASVTVEGVTESAWCQTPAGARHTMHTGTTPSGVIVAWTNEAERLTPPARKATT